MPMCEEKEKNSVVVVDYQQWVSEHSVEIGKPENVSGVRLVGIDFEEDVPITTTDLVIRIPDETCPVVDGAIRFLEELRTANSTLRGACTKYARINKGLYNAILEVQKKNAELQASLNDFSTFASWANYILLDCKEPRKAELIALQGAYIDLKKENALLCSIEELAIEICNIAENNSNISNILARYLSEKSSALLGTFKDKMKEKQKKALESAKQKLSPEELRLLNIDAKFEDIDDEDDD